MWELATTGQYFIQIFVMIDRDEVQDDQFSGVVVEEKYSNQQLCDSEQYVNLYFNPSDSSCKMLDFNPKIAHRIQFVS